MAHAEPASSDEMLENLFVAQVNPRLSVPDPESSYYAKLLADALDRAGFGALAPQFLVLVDRSPQVQAAMIFRKTPEGTLRLIGASPASTGKPGAYAHFETPLGVFDHSVANLDFRSEGTKNDNGILGYGLKGMRVYDFGWQDGVRGWGRGGVSPMRLQLHSTDPYLLEKRLGIAQSAGCIRIPASMNTFIDRYGVLDADYERAAATGRRLWMLRPDREPTPWSGRYLVVVDSQREQRPDWAPLPAK